MKLLWSLCVSVSIISNAILIGVSISFPNSPPIQLSCKFFWYVQISFLWIDFAITSYRTRSIPPIILILSLLSSIPIDSFRVLSLLLILPKIFITRISQRVYSIWLESLPGMLWGVLIITCSLWVMAIVYTEFFSSSTAWIFIKPSDSNFFDVSKYFGSNIQSFLTMLQIITMDHWMTSIARPLLSQYPIMLLFPLSLLFVFTYGLLNVMIGLVVRCSILLSDNSQSASSNNGDDQFAQVVQRLLVRRKISQIIFKLKKIS